GDRRRRGYHRGDPGLGGAGGGGWSGRARAAAGHGGLARGDDDGRRREGHHRHGAGTRGWQPSPGGPGAGDRRADPVPQAEGVRPRLSRGTAHLWGRSPLDSSSRRGQLEVEGVGHASLSGYQLHLHVDPSRCVACLACVRVCPTDAIALPPEARVVEIVEDNCIRCGECIPACPHTAITGVGAIDRAVEVAEAGNGLLILAPEAMAWFHPATPEQLVNACYEAGFRHVSRGVVGDELVAQEYLRLWEDRDWGTLIRSTDPVVVAAIVAHHPELIPYLAPVTYPCVAEARFLRHLLGEDLPVVYVGTGAPGKVDELDAAMTF